ncbi:MAG TPA: MFS transporter, partial [Bauldia sp.]|nr:MFS transporter [Bauldia sp.]
MAPRLTPLRRDARQDACSRHALIATADENPRGYRRRVASLSLAMLLPSLGTSVANVALPDLAASFGAPFQQAQWVVIGYLLAVTTLIIASGRAGDLYGRRRVLLMAIAMFMLASACGAIAPSLWLLVVTRIAQGAGAAGMMALSMASVSDVVPPQRTGGAMGLLGTVSAIGTALGPTLGGALIAAWGWPAVFLAMAIVGALTLAAVYVALPPDRPPG